MSEEPANEEEENNNERLARNVSELLSELRVVQAGVQILFGFLLSVVFTQTFRDASGFEKSLHLVAVLFAVISTALLTAPAAWHRVLFRESRREEILRVGNPVVIAGLVSLAGALVVTVALIAKIVFGPIAMAVMGPLVLIPFAVLWFVIPARLRRL